MLEDEIRNRARELSILLIGFSKPDTTDYAKIIHERIERGFITKEMTERTECFRTPEVYADPKMTLPNARTLICIGGAYLEKWELPSDMSRRAWIARHFRRDSYTDLQRKRDALIDFLRSKGFKAEKVKMHPRETARLTGIAWIGKNNFAINPTFGSWTLYYPLVTDALIEPTPRIQRSCPTNCRKCMDACPTKALVEPFVLDPRRCINYILEEDTPAPSYARHLIGNRINGCDICQEVCPMNKNVELAPQPLTARTLDKELVPFPTLERLFEVTDREMEQNYAHMDWYDSNVRYLTRNALIAVGNSNEKDLVHLAKKHGDSKDPVLKDHARWAIDRLS